MNNHQDSEPCGRNSRLPVLHRKAYVPILGSYRRGSVGVGGCADIYEMPRGCARSRVRAQTPHRRRAKPRPSSAIVTRYYLLPLLPLPHSSFLVSPILVLTLLPNFLNTFIGWIHPPLASWPPGSCNSRLAATPSRLSASLLALHIFFFSRSSSQPIPYLVVLTTYSPAPTP